MVEHEQTERRRVNQRNRKIINYIELTAILLLFQQKVMIFITPIYCSTFIFNPNNIDNKIMKNKNDII